MTKLIYPAILFFCISASAGDLEAIRASNNPYIVLESYFQQASDPLSASDIDSLQDAHSLQFCGMAYANNTTLWPISAKRINCKNPSASQGPLFPRPIDQIFIWYGPTPHELSSILTDLESYACRIEQTVATSEIRISTPAWSDRDAANYVIRKGGNLLFIRYEGQGNQAYGYCWR